MQPYILTPDLRRFSRDGKEDTISRRPMTAIVTGTGKALPTPKPGFLEGGDIRT